MYRRDTQRETKNWPTLTLAFGIVFVIVYLGQLLLAGSLSQNAGYQTATAVNNTVGSGSVVFSWLFHSSHTHLLGNLTIFLSTGWWVEKRVNDDRFIFGVAVVLGIGANVAAVIFFQILGAGISGITTGLVTMIALGAFEGLLDSTVAPMKGVLVFTISVLYALLSIGAIAPIPAGTAVEVHLLGAMFGAAWYATEKFRYDFSLNA